MIIDSHTHLGLMNKKKYETDNLLASMKKAGIDYSFVIANYSETDQGGLKTQEVIEIAEHNPILKAIGSIEIESFEKGQIDFLKKSLVENKICAVKFYPGYDGYYSNDKRFFSLFEFCQKNNYPVIFHTGFLETGYEGDQEQAHPKYIKPIAQQFPNLKIVIAHIGNPWIEEATNIVKQYKNVYCDVSALSSNEYTKMLSENKEEIISILQKYKSYVGNYEKCLFGTDFPIYNQKDCLDTISQINMTKKEHELVFSQNAKKIFNLDEK